MAQRKQFTFYRSYYEALKKLPKKHRLGVLEAILTYGLDGIAPEGLNDVQNAVFILVRPTLDAGRNKAFSGQRGGEANRKQTRSKGEKEIETETEIETEIESETETEIEDECLWRVGFEKFWDAFPVKIGKDRAAALWREELPDADAVLRGLERWKKSDQWNRENGRFVPRAAKFLEEKHYLQCPGEPAPRGVDGQLGQAEMEAIARVMREDN